MIIAISHIYYQATGWSGLSAAPSADCSPPLPPACKSKRERRDWLRYLRVKSFVTSPCEQGRGEFNIADSKNNHFSKPSRSPLTSNSRPSSIHYKTSGADFPSHQSPSRHSKSAPLQHAGNLPQPPLSQRHLSYPSHVAALSFRSPSSSWPSSPSPPQLPAATVTNRRTRSTTTMQVPVMPFHWIRLT